MRCYELLRILSRNLLIFIFLIPASAGVVIQLKEEVPYKEHLQLSSIASFKATQDVRQFIGSLTVSQQFLNDHVITADEVKALLRQNFIDIAQVRIIGSKVRLYEKRLLRKEVLEDRVRKFILANYKDVEIERIYISSLPLNIRDYSIRIKPSSKTFGHIYLNVEIFSHGKIVKHLNISVKVIEYFQVPIATKVIHKGERIDGNAFTMKRVRRYNSLVETLSPQSLIGSVARRDIKAQEVIKPFMIEPDFDVKKKSNVKIIYKKGPIQIGLLGLALENGKKGQIIKVKNLSSNKVLKCEVLSPGLVLYLY